MNLTNYGITSQRAERAEAEVYREHQAVEGWSLRAERAEREVEELRWALKRLASTEGFMGAISVSPSDPLWLELAARGEFARAALSEPTERE